MLGPGQVPCSVFPGDVNVDGIVNFGDKKGLNDYIHDANLNPNWLSGWYRLPPSYPKPLSEVEYVGQAAIPWNVPEGCHMDADGNGTVNSLDNVAIKMNWFRTHSIGANPKQNDGFNAASFDLAQNYPNPFNPSTTIKYQIPKPSRVQVNIYNTQGQIIETLVDQIQSAGYYQVNWQPVDLPSGIYLYKLETREYYQTNKLVFIK